MSEVLLSASERRKRALIDSEPALLWVVVTGIGLAVAVVGWTDLALLWYPLRFGSPEWEFATVSAHLDGMPLGTIGLGLVIAGAIARGWRRTSRFLSVISLLIALGLIVIFGLYLLDVPVALRAVAPEIKPLLGKAILKASAFALTYTALYGWLAWFLWRKTRLAEA